MKRDEFAIEVLPVVLMGLALLGMLFLTGSGNKDIKDRLDRIEAKLGTLPAQPPTVRTR